MKLRYALLPVAVLALSAFLSADDWNKTYTLNGRPTLKIDSSDAAVRVTGSDRKTIEARVTTEGYKIGPDGLRIIEHQAGNIVELEVRYPHGLNLGWGRHRVEIEVQMPREGTVGVRTGDGRIDINGIKGDVDTWSGDGAQQINSVDGTLRAHTGDGRMIVTGRFDVLDLNTGDGHIDATALANSTLAKDWALRTGDGSVTLRLPTGLAADVDLHTNDGHIRLDLPVQVSGQLGGNNVRGKMNGGGKLISVHTGDGSISLEKS